MSDEVKLEEEWVAKKEAIREAARRPPPKMPRKIAGVVAAMLLLAGATVAIVLLARSDRHPASGDRVRIEVRSMPAMEIKLDGKKLGTTPRTLVVPRSDKPVTIEASYTIRKYYRSGMVAEPHTQTRTVVPDHDRTIDFTAKR